MKKLILPVLLLVLLSYNSYAQEEQDSVIRLKSNQELKQDVLNQKSDNNDVQNIYLIKAGANFERAFISSFMGFLITGVAYAVLSENDKTKAGSVILVSLPAIGGAIYGITEFFLATENLKKAGKKKQ